MMVHNYRHSLSVRLRILFSPLRLAIFILSILWLIGLNIVYIRDGATNDWLGFISAAPSLGFFVWTMYTDRKYRRGDHE